MDLKIRWKWNGLSPAAWARLPRLGGVSAASIMRHASAILADNGWDMVTLLTAGVAPAPWARTPVLAKEVCSFLNLFARPDSDFAALPLRHRDARPGHHPWPRL